MGAREHLTPPLSPMAVAYPGHFVPEDEICELPQPCDPISRLSEDIAAAERKLFEAEFEFWADALENNDSPGRYDDIDVSEMIKAGEFRPPIPPSSSQPVPRGLKVDVPLLVCSDDDLNNVLEPERALKPDDLVEAKELIASSDTLSGSDGPTGQLVTAFQKSAITVMRHAEQEKLQPLDATTRVPVPVLDFSIPVPEWEQRLWEDKTMFQFLRENTNVNWQSPKWPQNRTAEQNMVWVPLPNIKEKKLMSDRIEVETEALEPFLKRGRDCDILTSVDYAYKEPGPVVLRIGEEGEDDDEECLAPFHLSAQTPTTTSQGHDRGEPASPSEGPVPTLQHTPRVKAVATAPPPADLTSLLSGRKRSIDETLHRRQSSVGRDGPVADASDISATGIIDTSLIPSTNVLRGFMSEYTDFAPLVDNFLEMNFPKKLKLTHSSFSNPPDTTPSSSRSKAEEAAKLMPPPPKPIPALAPPINRPQSALRVVISTTVSKPLTQHLQTLLPTIELIPRDYNKHRPTGWIPGARSPNLDEADIVASPATGILLTTMVQLRQRALPGRAAPPPVGNNNNNANANNSAPTTSFCRVVSNVAVRHERVVVLVSEGNRHSETAGPLSPSDARALAEFQGFAAGLAATTAEVRVVYVGGGVETLARWVAAVVCECVSGEAEGVREMLLPVETFWEVFLRRAGMNVFAAQVVLGTLKVPDGRPAVGGGDGQVFGLPCFVTMARERRVELFGELLGGRRVLDRVSDVLDEPWGQRVVDECGSDFRVAPAWGGF
ncbi:hypothetical protein CHGG_04197 [Chaetomium globosum CBS 148.51]|uniref:Uncharacterized protein n=1 Tax=Chaetomium globosum (strain ATCC 6205 / CBS 148.51 / DSM 1962 / NBRC 6347 / NRRL 1970) TaxID=306901 RepID=Q2H1Z9_CHAGB|nr:uncharacterized protein CHGG_04197 [Chaetomium globosum CBS 148.51]EAQ87578.1 hypothetical protein CHGG_04197 [Chaetomium globosum CBS 148.51]